MTPLPQPHGLKYKLPWPIGSLRLWASSVKFWACPPEEQRYKGRLCFRDDIVRDEQGALAVFRELSAHPTTIQDASANVAYGALPGHESQVADAIRAYI